MTRLTRDVASLWFEAPFVIAMRCQDMAMAAAAGKPQDTVEIGRMIQEKMTAAAQAGLAVQGEMARQSIDAFWQLALGGRPKVTQAKKNRLSAKAVAPFAQQVRRNTRRLKKTEH
ncbi:hypothetical protein ACSSVZ_002509 [Amorphus sp. MBR-141]